MNEKQIQSLMALIQRLYRQKYPVVIIVIIVLVSLVVNHTELLYSPKFSSDECEVLKVYDGDTMTLKCSDKAENTKVRMYCIDTPEMKQTPWGIEARDHLRSIAGTRVKLVKMDQDRYGRIVGEVYNGDLNLNLAQVKAGKAAVYDAYCQKSEYKVAENEAKKAHLGIWSQGGLQQTPWEWRKQQRKS